LRAVLAVRGGDVDIDRPGRPDGRTGGDRLQVGRGDEEPVRGRLEGVARDAGDARCRPRAPAAAATGHQSLTFQCSRWVFPSVPLKTTAKSEAAATLVRCTWSRTVVGPAAVSRVMIGAVA